MKKTNAPRRTPLGKDLAEAFLELAVGLRGEVELEECKIATPPLGKGKSRLRK